MHTLDFAGASRGLLDFIDRTPDAFFAVKNMACPINFYVKFSPFVK